ncbi:DUF3902 family protein (plasmid) [Bacillus cereus]|uniref:DUF3902 family protein n=1 Tax=Bacillus cereus TaxID=1396 RepID=UPI001298C0B0|nr:DUF3902 family protein [Bacillus cereus]MED2474139.1 DUF3902 family protein [Bacillus thuringiensis]MEB9914550.1 DUF3902 family protein [Bacillus cereus]MED2575671.1 DUF3902 family protein [Bacillus thuringiensis]MED2652402.1 DUF3902 family protein [Bacillus thuringiensis]MRB49037.1 DUF3902 family protein [Bacillus thuringiensis]
MKPVLKRILISFVFSAIGMCWLLFVVAKLHGDWLCSLLGVLLGYLSLFTIINLFCKNNYQTASTKALIKIAVISFNFSLLGISYGIMHELLIEKVWGLSLMANYWSLVLILYITTIIPLIILVFVKRNNQYYTWFYRFLILLSLFFTLCPVLLPIFIAILGNGMNASSGW